MLRDVGLNVFNKNIKWQKLWISKDTQCAERNESQTRIKQCARDFSSLESSYIHTRPEREWRTTKRITHMYYKRKQGQYMYFS